MFSTGVKTLPQPGCLGIKGSVALARWQKGGDAMARVGQVSQMFMALGLHQFCRSLPVLGPVSWCSSVEFL